MKPLDRCVHPSSRVFLVARALSRGRAVFLSRAFDRLLCNFTANPNPMWDLADRMARHTKVDA